MAVYSYLADIVATDERTKRMGWLDAVWYLGGPIGTWLGGWLYHSYGSVTVFSVSAALWLFCFLYVVFVIKETVVLSTVDSSSVGFCGIIADFGRTAIQSYPHNGRFHLFSLIALKLGVFLSQGHQVLLEFYFILISYLISLN
jgi:MFS family permease